MPPKKADLAAGLARVSARRAATGADDHLAPITKRVMSLPIERVRPNPHQPRRHFDAGELEALAASIARHGQQQPIRVMADPDTPDGYLIVGGERRWRACQHIGRAHIDVLVTAGDLAELALLDNLHRADLSPLDLADAVAGLMADDAYTDDDMAILTGLHRTDISRLRRAADLPEDVRHRIAEAGLSRSVVFLVVDTADDALRERLLERALAGASVRELRELRRRAEQAGDPPPEPPRDRPQRPRLLRPLGKAVEAVTALPAETLDEPEREQLRQLRDRIDALLGETS